MTIAPRKPDLNITCMNKVTGQKSGKIGAAWVTNNPDGSIKMINFQYDFGFTPLVGPDITFAMFPNTASYPTTKKSKSDVEGATGNSPLDDSGFPYGLHPDDVSF